MRLDNNTLGREKIFIRSMVLILISKFEGKYFCHVNNSVGEGEACMIELTGTER